jgi:hypothetical protein
MASTLLSGAPPARRGAGHPRPDGQPHAASRDAGTREPGGHYSGVSWGWLRGAPARSRAAWVVRYRCSGMLVVRAAAAR